MASCQSNNFNCCCCLTVSNNKLQVWREDPLSSRSGYDISLSRWKVCSYNHAICVMAVRISKVYIHIWDRLKCPE